MIFFSPASLLQGFKSSFVILYSVPGAAEISQLAVSELSNWKQLEGQLCAELTNGRA